MQEVYQDGSLGEIKTADTLEELLPMIKESLAHPRVMYVIVSINGQKVQVEEERTTDIEKLENMIPKPAIRTFPRKRRNRIRRKGI